MTAYLLIALACGLAALLIVAVARYRRSNHGTHRAPGHRADPFAGVEPGDYDWRDEDPDIGTMTFTGPMPKVTGDTYDLAGWEPLRPLPVQTVNLPPWENEPITPQVLRDRYEPIGGTVTHLPRPQPEPVTEIDDTPAAQDYDYDTFVYLAHLSGEFDREHRALEAWGRELVTA